MPRTPPPGPPKNSNNRQNPPPPPPEKISGSPNDTLCKNDKCMKGIPVNFCKEKGCNNYIKVTKLYNTHCTFHKSWDKYLTDTHRYTGYCWMTSDRDTPAC